MPIVAIAPELKSRLSLSTPSEKITPADGICDSIVSGAPGFRRPATIPAADCLLMNGSRTTNSSAFSSHFIWIGFTGFPLRKETIPMASLKIEDSHPELPAPVETIMPHDD